jgi:putative ABC transport system permease protein
MSWINRLATLVRSKRLDAELDEELQFHIESRVQQYLADGLTPEEAWRRARLAFGGADRVREECRQADAVQWLDTAWRDVKYALRTLRASPLFTGASVLSLALGIGANTAVFTLLYASLWKSLPVKEPGQIVHLMRSNPANPGDEPSYSYKLFGLIAEAAQPYGEVIAKSVYGLRKFGSDISSTERVVGEAVSGNYFSALRVDPVIGRAFEPGDDSLLGGNRVVVLSHAFWTHRFSADASVLGRTVYYREVPYTVVGVAGQGFGGVEAEAAVDVWVPITTDLPKNALSSPNYNSLRLIARLRSGASPTAMQAVLDTVFRSHLESEVWSHLPVHFRADAEAQHLVVRPASAGFAVMGRKYQRSLMILLAVVALVLLISCANVANLMMARNRARAREINVRMALGAGRGRIASQLFAESVLLALAGAVGGAVLAMWSCRLVIRLLPASAIPLAFDFRPNLAVMGFTSAVAIATALLFGIAPAIRAARANEGSQLKSGARTTQRTVTARILVAGQLALSLLLLIAAGLFLETVRNFKAIDLGFLPDHLVIFNVSFPRATPPDRIRQIYAQVRSGLASSPDIISASYDTGGGWSASAEIEGQPASPGEDNEVGVIAAGPDWFETIGVGLLEGRYLRERDAADAPPVAVVNKRLAHHFFGNTSPLGRRMRFNVGGNRPQVREIVGVVRDAKHYGVKGRDWPVAFLPTDHDGSFLVRTRGDFPGIGKTIRAVVAASGGTAQVEGIRQYAEVINDSLDRERMVAALSAVFGGLATLLAAIGLYGVLAYGVSRRTAELGIRMALGAQRGDVQWLVFRETASVLAAGTCVGLIAAFASTRLVATMLYGVRPVDWLVFTGAALVLAVVAALAGWLPARRASRINPMVALRCE